MKPSTINIHEAKTHLSRLVDEVCNGKELILAKAGKRLVKLVPLEKAKATRTPGVLKGKFKFRQISMRLSQKIGWMTLKNPNHVPCGLP
jgi:prevent-host-death family protein